MLTNDEEGHPRLVGWLGPTETFGELSLVSDATRLLTIRATNEVVLYELGVASFQRLRAERPQTCLLVIMALIKRLSHVINANQELLKRVLLRELDRV